MRANATRGAFLTDHDLIAATSASRVHEYEDAGRRVYTATFEVRANGRLTIVTRTFAVGHSEAAGIYAREYAARILPAGTRVVSVRWAR